MNKTQRFFVGFFLIVAIIVFIGAYSPGIALTISIGFNTLTFMAWMRYQPEEKEIR